MKTEKENKPHGRRTRRLWRQRTPAARRLRPRECSTTPAPRTTPATPAPTTRHLPWRLYERQSALLPGLSASEAFIIAALPSLGAREQIAFRVLKTLATSACTAPPAGEKSWPCRGLLDPRSALLHPAGEPQVPGDRLDSHARRVRLHRRAQTSSTTCLAMCRCSSTRCSPDYVQRYGTRAASRPTGWAPARCSARACIGTASSSG